MDLPLLARSAMSAALPVTARPTRQVSPTMPPSRLRRQLMRCSVRSMPARLSSPNSPTCVSSAEQCLQGSQGDVHTRPIF